ncbi:hypothetical protein PROFUN_09713 [Planoprotostelium fungivorum]|uniref:Uncharacterized protein n=1 Tax=Planoprotostelium fungivorum TaxID=1890364 RepID=A0A2P6NET3_9EUKA|nr:hypothetical protein PROFUN_09713 [Planoprotostelium fungivorum]
MVTLESTASSSVVTSGDETTVLEEEQSRSVLPLEQSSLEAAISQNALRRKKESMTPKSINQCHTNSIREHSFGETSPSRDCGQPTMNTELVQKLIPDATGAELDIQIAVVRCYEVICKYIYIWERRKPGKTLESLKTLRIWFRQITTEEKKHTIFMAARTTSVVIANNLTAENSVMVIRRPKGNKPSARDEVVEDRWVFKNNFNTILESAAISLNENAAMESMKMMFNALNVKRDNLGNVMTDLNNIKRELGTA